MTRAAIVAVVLAGCNAVPTTRLASLAVSADPDANAGYATALDVVFAFTPKAVDALPQDGPAWFARRDAILADQADALQVVHVQLPPARSADIVLPAGAGRAIGVYSFANYIPAPGQARGNLTPYPRLTIRLGRDAISYLER